MPKICLRYAQDMPMIYPRCAQDIYSKCPGAKCPWGKMSFGQNVNGAKCPWGKMSPSPTAMPLSSMVHSSSTLWLKVFQELENLAIIVFLTSETLICFKVKVSAIWPPLSLSEFSSFCHFAMFQSILKHD